MVIDNFNVMGLTVTPDETYAPPATDYYEHKLTVTKGKIEEEIKIQEGNQFALEMDHLA